MSCISVVVVAYNSKISDIPVIKEALSCGLIRDLVLCDNSTMETGNAEAARELGIGYVSMGGNRGLPKAYAAGASRCAGDVICLFDDDTEVDDSYFRAVASLLGSGKSWDIALPLVLGGGHVLSPCVFKGYRARAFPGAESVREDPFLSGINSGMAIKASLLNRVKHDQSLFLDFVDHRYVADARGAGASIVYLEGPVLKQDYSLETDSADSALFRLSIFEKDARNFYSASLVKRLYCGALLLFRKAKLCVRYRSAAFLKSNLNDRKVSR